LSHEIELDFYALCGNAAMSQTVSEDTEKKITLGKPFAYIILSIVVCIAAFLAFVNWALDPPRPKIVFYGKVEDQFGDSLSEFPIRFEVRRDGFMSQRIETGTTISDKLGLFKISGYRGDELSVVPEKVGYGFASTNGYARYSQDSPARQIHHPDPIHPVVIRMWKAQGAEPLFQLDHIYKLAHTSQWLTFDLIQGTNVENGGDIRMRVHRPPGVLVPTNTPTWTVDLETVDGGMMESKGSEEITYFAPEGDYQRALTFSNADPLPVSGTETLGTGLYLKSRNGQIYSRIFIQVVLNRLPEEPLGLYFRGFANTNWSRNWEAAPNFMKRN
jgi:hypothetical protein